MNCPHCDTHNDDRSIFCSYCGNRLDSPPAYEQPKYERPQYEQPRYGQGEPQAPGPWDDSAQGSQETPQSAVEPSPPVYAQQGIPPEQPVYAQPAGAPPPYRSALPENTVPDYQAFAITMLVLCVLTGCCGFIQIIGIVLSIIAIVKASEVKRALREGNLSQAQEASRTAKVLCWISFGLLIAGLLLFVTLIVTSALSVDFWNDFLQQNPGFYQDQFELYR